MTNSLIGRTDTHREGVHGTHPARYNIHRLVYFEYFRYVRSAIARENELKKWTRKQKIGLIEKANPTWDDLFPELIAPEQESRFPSGMTERKAKTLQMEAAENPSLT